ncbi:MAG: ABC transporter permease [Cellulomonas sp.]|nr:ABC transporter permease [Cellulomonas sp.]
MLVLTALVVALAAWGRVGLRWFPLWAVLRATAQLGVVALLLRGILGAPWAAAAFLVLMLTTASWTAGARVRDLRHGRRIAALGVVVGASVTLALVVALRLVDLEVRYLVAVAGIVIGNSMTAATLAGRNFLRDARQRRDEVEAWLSLGATPTEAHCEIGREAVRESLLPTLDQTKSTGLVTLPGAFVGAIFGGASPVEAAQFQLVVLAGLALAMTTTALIVTRLAGRTPYVTPFVTGARASGT